MCRCSFYTVLCSVHFILTNRVRLQLAVRSEMSALKQGSCNRFTLEMWSVCVWYHSITTCWGFKIYRRKSNVYSPIFIEDSQLRQWCRNFEENTSWTLTDVRDASSQWSQKSSTDDLIHLVYYENLEDRCFAIFVLSGLFFSQSTLYTNVKILLLTHSQLSSLVKVFNMLVPCYDK